MSNVVPKQARVKARKPAHRNLRSAAAGPVIVDDQGVTLVPQARLRRPSEDVEQMFIDLTRRAPAPAVGPSHWWG